MLLLSNLALGIAILANPWLLARNLGPRANVMTTLALAGPAFVSLGMAAPIALHIAGIPIAPLPLSVLHGAVFLTLAAITRLRSINWRSPQSPSLGQSPFASATYHPFVTPGRMALLFSVLVIPFTPLAGIDTFKWQDLAGVIQVEKAISWMVHPASLFGFTPRSYSSAQPILLASIGIMSGAGVDWSFYIFSVVCGMIGLFSTIALGRHLLANASLALWMGFLYVFSPVFLRYNFWATGRGLFMALLPVFVLGLVNINRSGGIAGAVWCAILLALAHKSGLPAGVLIPAACLAGIAVLPAFPGKRPLTPPVWIQVLTGALMLAAVAIGFALAGHSPLTSAIRIITRPAILFPLALIGLVGVPFQTHNRPAIRAMTMAAIISLPLVFFEEMYGSLIAVLFIAFMATLGLESLAALFPPRHRAALLHSIIAIVLLQSLIIIIHQSADSPSRDVVRAAGFLNRHDPLGPYRVVAPGLTRQRIQAYLDGCPRFNMTASTQSTAAVRPLPPFTGNIREDAARLTSYLRVFLTVPDVSTDWYGNTKKVYYVTEDGRGMLPPGARRLFTSGNISVYDNPAEP